jgi:hypothetical protein
MLDGRKPDVPEGAAIASARPVAALLMLALMAMAGYVLWKGYEPGAGTLRAFGVTRQLGENEAEQGRHAHVRGELKHESAGEDD